MCLYPGTLNWQLSGQPFRPTWRAASAPLSLIHDGWPIGLARGLAAATTSMGDAGKGVGGSSTWSAWVAPVT
eukprot:399623-Amphidinium_carterae.1